MAVRFTAHEVGADEDDETLTAGVADGDDNALIFMCALDGPDDLEALGLADPEIEVTLETDPEAVDQFGEALRRILTYGDPAQRPAVLDLPAGRSA